MPINYRSELAFKLTEDTSGQDVLFQRVKDVVTDGDALAEGAVGRMRVADTDGEVSVDLGGVSVAGVLFLETDQDLNVKLDGALVQLRPVAGQVAKIVVEFGSFATLTVQAPTVGVTATVTFAAAGA